VVQQKGKLSNAVHPVPRAIEDYISIAKLASMGITIDSMTPDQADYSTSWEHGT